MNYDTLVQELKSLKVTPYDVCRASLYIPYLHAAKKFFVDTSNDQHYKFVKKAVRSPSLLQELANILDFYVAPAVMGELNHVKSKLMEDWTYRDYFDKLIFTAERTEYIEKLKEFLDAYPNTGHALDKLFCNFKNNIAEACKRVIYDKQLITKFYSDLYDGLEIKSLNRIKSTGSDFHKGGKQVLILTFEICYQAKNANHSRKIEKLKVVYKPSDIEIDCLIAGNSDAINAVIPSFMKKSLFEIYNNRSISMSSKPADTCLIDTYRILPRNCIRKHPEDYPLPIRDAYGYIQYLDYTREDYLITNNLNNQEEIIKSFYRKLGALSALACTFSIEDMHMENIRVNKFKPYLIDLEISLTKNVNDISDTVLFTDDGVGGIDGVWNQINYWRLTNETISGKASLVLSQSKVSFDYQNRLWSVAQDNQKEYVVPIDKRELIEGFTNSLKTLRESVMKNDYDTWFERIQNVLVRYIPGGTKDFEEIRNNVFLKPQPLKHNHLETIGNELRVQRTKRHSNFKLNNEIYPNFLCFTERECVLDYNDLDIPVFYHRVGTLDVLNSRGEKVEIPSQVTIDDSKVVVVNLGRKTFFSNPPTKYIQEKQVTNTGSNEDDYYFINRMINLTTSLIQRIESHFSSDLGAKCKVRPINRTN